MFGDLAKGKRNWQLAAFAALGLAFVLGGGLISVATQSRITPYVIEIDSLSVMDVAARISCLISPPATRSISTRFQSEIAY